jgi:hypothetical protein
MNLMAFHSMPEKAGGWEALTQAGYNGVQFASPGTQNELAQCRALGLGIAGSGRINLPEQSAVLAEQLAGDGYECATLHVGWGMESDAEADRLIESILEASDRWRIPLYVETHRATVCQDMWRTVQLVQRFPSLRFNGDFSHWYTGQEMVYGGFEKKLAFIKPVLDRVGFLHGRIANPGCIQVPVQEGATYVDHFQQLWTASFEGFLQTAQSGDFICFTPELLAPDIFYAREFQGAEESNRWEQSLKLKQIAERCFSQALQTRI